MDTIRQLTALRQDLRERAMSQRSLSDLVARRDDSEAAEAHLDAARTAEAQVSALSEAISAMRNRPVAVAR